MIFEGCLRLIGQVNASGNGSQTFQICSMTYNHKNYDQFVTIAHDGMIKVWDSNNLTLKRSTRIKSGYLTSLIIFQGGFIVGTGNGQLIKFTINFERELTKKVHFDCVNDMLQTENHLISIGSDGKICFLNKTSFSIEKEIQTSVPLFRISRFKEEIFVTGNPSFKIDLKTYEVMKEKRSFQFMEISGEIFGCSDEEGLFILGNSDHIRDINCNFMLKLNQFIITVSEGAVGFINLLESEGAREVGYRLYKASKLKKGYSIKTGLIHGNQIILAGEEGFIYKFKLSNLEENNQQC